MNKKCTWYTTKKSRETTGNKLGNIAIIDF